MIKWPHSDLSISITSYITNSDNDLDIQWNGCNSITIKSKYNHNVCEIHYHTIDITIFKYRRNGYNYKKLIVLEYCNVNLFKDLMACIRNVILDKRLPRHLKFVYIK